mgnify:CR=1 FL=1
MARDQAKLRKPSLHEFLRIRRAPVGTHRWRDAVGASAMGALPNFGGRPGEAPLPRDFAPESTQGPLVNELRA